MSEAGDYTPSSYWKGHDFGAARAAYDRHVDRGYSAAVSAGKSLDDVLPESLETDSSAPLIVVCDVTGSMGEWPAVIFSKLPYLDHECKTEYLGEDYAVSFCAVGDAQKGDRYPVQARPFAREAEIKERLGELVIERGGGSGGNETYELAALYLARNARFPKAVRKPVLVFIGDEMPYDMVTKDMAKRYAKVNLEKERLTVEEIFAELMAKFSVYLIRCPYGSVSEANWEGSQDQRHYERWVEIFGGRDRIVNLPEPGRAVDVLFGLLAREAGKIKYFRKELEGRQDPGQVETVYKSLATVHALPEAKGKGKKGKSGKSVMKQLGDGKKTKKLV